MIQRDYIQRMIEQLAKVVAKLMGKDPKQSIEILSKNYDEWLGFRPDYISSIPEEDLLYVLVNKNNLNINQLEFLAELLAKEGEQYLKTQEFSIAKDKLNKSLTIFDFVDAKQELFSMERMNTISNIKSALNSIEE